MASSIGSLSIEVLADIAGMVSDLGRANAENAKAAREFQKQWQESINTVQESFKTLAELVGVGFSIEKVAEFTKSVVEAGLQIYDISLKTGISAQTLSSYSVAAQEAGVTVDVFANALSKMARSANDAAHGSAAQVNAFAQLGVSVTDAAGHLKGANQLLDEVSIGLDKLQDGLGKTAIVTEIFGRGGATLIPLLSDLGEGVDVAREKAEKFGLAISDAEAKALKAFDVSLTDAGLAIRGTFTQALLEALPSLQRAATQILDFVQNSQELKSAVTAGADAVVFLANHLHEISTILKDVSELVAASLFLKLSKEAYIFAEGLVAAGAAALTLKTTLQSIIPIIAAAQIGTAIGEWADQFTIVKQAGAGLVGVLVIGWDLIKGSALIAFAAIEGSANTVINAIRNSFADLIHSIASGMSQIPGQGIAAAQMQAYADALHAASAAAPGLTQSVGDAVAAMEKEIAADKENVNGLISYYGTVEKARSVLSSFTVEQKEAKEATDGFAKSNSDATLKLIDELAKWQEQMDQLAEKSAGPYDAANLQFLATMAKLDQEIVVMIGHGLSLAEAERMDAQASDLATAAYWRQIAADVARNDKADDYIQRLIDEAAQLEAVTNAQKAAAEFDKIAAANMVTLHDVYGQFHATQELVNQANADAKPLWTQNTAAIMDHIDVIRQSQDLLKSWASTLSQDAMSTFNTFLKDVEHGGDIFKDLGKAFENLVNQIIAEAFRLLVVGPIINSVFGLSGSSALPTGNLAQGALAKIFGGSSGTGSGGMMPSFGGASHAGDADFFNGGAAGAGDLAYSGPGSSFGFQGGGSAALGIGAGIYAGYNEFNAAGGGIAGIAGGAAYGIGTVAISGALSAGVAAAATGGISAGIAAGFEAIPVVGWIALAAMGLNMITGGGLFGTAAKPYGSEENLSVGPAGADISAAIDEKGKKALFQGSYWKTVNQPVDQQTLDSVSAFFDGLQKAATAEATAFGQTTSVIVTGSFHETFDKAGKMLTEVSTVAGQKFTESIQDFQSRIIADTLLANMGDASAEAQKIAEQWQSSASALLAGAGFLSQAELDIEQGHALVEGDTLTQLTAFVTGMAAQGESLIQTYARLSAEVSDVQGILSNLGLDTGKTGEALVKFDDDMVKAAGSLQNLNTLWNDYFNDYYSASERAAIKLKGDQFTLAALGKSIGQDPSESMAQFRANFEAALPTLTPEQVIQWLLFGEALNTVTADMGGNTTQAQATSQALQQANAQYQAFVAQFKTTSNDFTEFENSVNSLGGSMTDDIAKANALAIAAGMAGASTEDLGAIITSAAQKGVAAFRQMEAQAQSLAASLYGTNVDQLKAQLTSLEGMGIYADQGEELKLEKQIAAANQQQEAAKRLTDASTLLQEFGEIGAFTGASLKDIAAQFHVPLDKFAADLGLTTNGLNDAFKHQEDAANAALKGNELLQDIVDLLQGIPINPNVQATDAVIPDGGGKGVGRGGVALAPAGADVATAVTQGNEQNASDMAKQNTLLTEQNALLRQLIASIGSTPNLGTRRNAGAMPVLVR